MQMEYKINKIWKFCFKTEKNVRKYVKYEYFWQTARLAFDYDVAMVKWKIVDT